MPMYYFCLQDDEHVEDTEGAELADLDAAREHAVAVAKELTFRRRGMLGRDWSRWTLSVRDEYGKEMASFCLDEFRDEDTHDAQ